MTNFSLKESFNINTCANTEGCHCFTHLPNFGASPPAIYRDSFSSNTYSGVSDKPRYPAFCDGTYNIEKQKIIFVNACVWTADFDWSLILSGEYNFTLIGKLLVITRSFLGSSTDTWIDKYTLTKQE